MLCDILIEKGFEQMALQAIASVPYRLKPECFAADTPLFSRCSPAVTALFSSERKRTKMTLNQSIIEVPAAPPQNAEQQVSATPLDAPAEVEAQRPRGRPWVKGQSGNPHGRPSRAYQAAYVAESLIGRKTVPLTNKLIELALRGDRVALRLCLDRIAPPRREPPIDLDLPTIKSRADLLVALTAIAEAAGTGALTASQSATLTRTLIALR